MAKTVGALLLAGGSSSRMGRNKALLPYEDGTFLSHAALALDFCEEKPEEKKLVLKEIK